MPVFQYNNFKPSLFFRNGLINTIYPYFFRKIIPHPFERVRIYTPDQDFFDIDWLKNPHHTKLAILLHGLEGSSDSQYINGITNVLNQEGFDIAAVNFRSCSGEINLKPEMYHSGYTKDLEFIIQNLTYDYNQVVIAGFSLGSNVTLKYVGQQGKNIDSKIKAIAAISVPCDLRGVSLQLKKWYNYPYEKLFLKTLMQKMEIKSKMFPEIVDKKLATNIKSLWDFDEYYNAAIHNFENADDYYDQNSSLLFLDNIQIPTLIINSKDDSFLSKSCYPYDAAENNDHIHLIVTAYGGHTGFSDVNQSKYWSEQVIESFFKLFTD